MKGQAGGIIPATSDYFFIPLTRSILTERLPFSFFLNMIGGKS
jgi:hypothetical protein